MKLKLTIINSDINLDVRKEVVFDHQGGVIGRKEGSDWVLPDAKRFISSRHAIIRFEDNGFLLGDLSTNGIYINDASSPIGNGNFVRINSGDQFKIGDYNILISVQDEIPESFTPPSVQSNFSDSNESLASNVNIFPENMDPLELLGMPNDELIPPVDTAADMPSTQSSLDSASADQDFFQPSQLESVTGNAGAIPTNWAELSDDEGKRSEAIPKTQQQKLSGDVNSSNQSTGHISPNVVVHNQVDLEIKKPEQQSDVVSNTASSENHQLSDKSVSNKTTSDKAMGAFVLGLGMPPEMLEDSDINNVMFEFGQVLRTTVEGLKEILSARAELKSEFRMNYTTIRVKENNPLKFSLSVDDALNNLFLKKGEGYLTPKEAIDEAVENMKDHQIALLAGMKAALGELVQEFDPVDVENSVEKYMEMASKIPLYRKAKSWDLYCENYKEFRKGMGDNFQNMFGHTFSEAYEKQISDLSLMRGKDKK